MAKSSYACLCLDIYHLSSLRLLVHISQSKATNICLFIILKLFFFFHRMKNEHNKMPAHTKPSKLLSAPLLSDRDIENRDPGVSETGRKAPVRPGVSRLPVLAKSLRLQTPSDFTQSHCRWEEKPLAVSASLPSCTCFFLFNQMILVFLLLHHFPTGES